MFGVIILAAGASSRMGRPKMLLPWNGTTILGHLITTWQTLKVEQIGVVVASESADIRSELDRLRFPVGQRILNSTPELGMFSSIQAAASWTGWNESIRTWVIVLGDQPHLRVSTLRGLIEHSALHRNEVCQPSRMGRPRHPVILPEPVFRRLKESTAGNLKQFLNELFVSAFLCPFDDPGLDFDIDRPEDYERAVEQFSVPSSLP